MRRKTERPPLSAAGVRIITLTVSTRGASIVSSVANPTPSLAATRHMEGPRLSSDHLGTTTKNVVIGSASLVVE